jgi:enamine deaminase RidA (YjgF/YER057c/UK114 family)
MVRIALTNVNRSRTHEPVAFSTTTASVNIVPNEPEPDPMSATDRLQSLGLTLPPPPAPIGNYVPYRIGGNLLFLSGVGPRKADGSLITGKVGGPLSIEQGYEAAKICALNMLTNMIGALGSLDRVDTILKVLGMVNSTPDFQQHPRVIDGCTDLLVAVFGDDGRPARSAVGMTSLPRDIAVEVEAVILIRP